MMILLAEAAAAVVTTPAPESPAFSIYTLAALLFGIVAKHFAGWVADFVNGKGAEFVSAKIDAMQTKLNENSLLGQIAADDAVTAILTDAIPTVIARLTETAKNDLKDGKFDKVDWDGIGTQLWDEVKDQIVAGKNDYLAQSSFDDGKAIASWVIQNFFKKKKLAAEGVIPPATPAK